MRARGLSPLQLDADKFDVTYTVIYGLVVLGSAVLAVFGGVALRRGNRHLAASAAELLAEDPRPPVLYLRSFRADKGMAHPTKMSSLRDFLLPYTPIEAGLVEALGAVGPVVALGDPEERLPWVGAARAYVGNDEWQTQVAGWAQSARLIVMLAGETKSFYWEIQHVNAMNSLSKTWILVPRDAARYARFRAAFAEHAQGVDLPAWPRTIKSEGFVVAGIVSFPSGGTPRFTTLPHTAPDTVTEWRDILRSVSSATVRAPG